MWVRTSAGWLLIAAGTGLAAISGTLAYHGFEAMIAIPFAGWIGPCIAASLIGLGIAVETEIRERHWVGAGVLLVLLIGAGWLDKHSGQLALTAKIEAAAQVDADRRQAFETARDLVTKNEAAIAGLDAQLAIITGADTKAAQQLLGVIVDGRRGPDTVAALKAREVALREEIAVLKAEIRDARPVVAAGAPVSTLPFTLKDAELYATLVTLLSIVLAFAGSYVAHGPVRDEVAETEAALGDLERNVFQLHDWLESRAA